MAIESEVSVQEFNEICADLPNTLWAHVFMKQHRTLMESKAKSLHKQFGRGAFLIHFRTLEDYQARRIQSTKKVINSKNHLCVELFIAHKKGEVIIINDQILWVPLCWIEQYYQVKKDSVLRYYPLSVAYCALFVTYKSMQEDVRYYICIMNDSLRVHSSNLFESRLKQFASTMTSIKSSKTKYFKEQFPKLYDDLVLTGKIKPFSFDLTKIFWPIIKPNRILEQMKQFEETDNFHCPFHDKYGSRIPELYVAVTQWNTGYDLDEAIAWLTGLNLCRFVGLYICGKIGYQKAECILTDCIKIFNQYHVLDRIKIGLYGSKCFHCNAIANGRKKKHRFKICSGYRCKHRWYCPKRCQKLDWKKEHRQHCEWFKIIHNYSFAY